jgi:hypothetical protein
MPLPAVRQGERPTVYCMEAGPKGQRAGDGIRTRDILLGRQALYR